MRAELPGRFSLGKAVDIRAVKGDPERPSTSDELHHLQLGGRILIQGTEDAPCTVQWVYGRTARASIDRAERSVDGHRAVVYMDLIGRIEGMISWISATEIDIAIAAPSAKWDRLQRQFAAVAAMAPADRENLRGHRRIAPDLAEVRLSLADERTTEARIRDVSRSGAAVTANLLPELGTIVTLGATRGKVVRLLDDGGFAVQFLRLLPLERFGVAYVL